MKTAGNSMKSIKHILFLTPGFPADESDSNCIPALQVYIRCFKKIFPEIDCSVISLQYPYRPQPYSWNGIHVYPCNGRNKSGVYKLVAWKKAKQYFNSLKQPDIIHSFWIGEACLLGHRFAKKPGISHFTTLMGQDALHGNSYLKLLDQSALQIISPSLFSLEKLKENSTVQFGEVIPWGVEQFGFNPGEKKDIDLLGVGSLIALKRFNIFVDVVEKLRSIYPEIKAVLIGDGPERYSLEKIIQQKELNNNIEMMGEMRRNEVMHYMNKSKVLFHPSSYESFGMVFAEALQAGMKIVSLKTGCYFKNNDWIGVDTETEFNDALKKALETTYYTQGNSFFAIEETCRKYFDLYSK